MRETPKAARVTTKESLDAMCREIIMERDGNVCRRCGKGGNLQWCHVFTRRILAVRWDLDNSWAGCRGCHCWWHEQPIEASEWWRKEIGEERFEILRLRANKIRGTEPTTELTFVRLLLESERERIRGGGVR